MRKVIALTIGVLVSCGVTTASAQGEGAKTKLSVDVAAQRFVVDGDQVVARGPVTAKVVRADGTTETVHQKVNLKVKTTSNCRILDLHLAKLYLNLLGLEVRTSEVNLRVSGDPKRTLGELFCDLSEGLKLDKNALARRSARSLNKALDSRPLPVFSFRAPIRSQEQPPTKVRRGMSSDVPPVPPGSCEVLDLLLGPLHLDLLGLVVDLYGPSNKDPVQVLVTANPNGGVVGASLCELAASPPPV